MSAREDIAAAASSVPGIKVTPKWQAATKPGTGFVDAPTINAIDGTLTWEATWEVVVCIGQDINAAYAWLDENLEQLLEALDGELILTSATPVPMQVGETRTNGVIIAGTREWPD